MKYMRNYQLLVLLFSLPVFTLQACTAKRGAILNTQEIVVSSVGEILEAVKTAKQGDVILVKSGDYKFEKRIDIQVNGTEQLPIALIAHRDNNTRPLFDFSALGEADSNQGIILRASYWQIKGIDLIKAGDNGILINGNNNLIENCSFSECSDTGLQLDSHAANNLILNCDSYFNADSKIENADGFACKIDVGSGNKFKGCRAWQNLDDGWDGYLKQTDNVSTVFEDCWAFNNGMLKDGKLSGGDGNGFKTGGSDNKLLKHNTVYTNCVSAGNLKNGFDHNSNRGEVTLISCKAYGNQQKNFSFGKKNPVSKLTIKDCIVLGEVGSLEADVKEISGNNWQLNRYSQPDRFQSVNIDELKKPRKADGSLPDITFMKVK